MDIKKLIKFARIVGKLKKLKRTGWFNNNIPDPESVAEHSFRSAVLAMILAPRFGVNTEKAMKMALIHDIGEAEIGDIVTVDGIKVLKEPAVKTSEERKYLKQILDLIDKGELIKLFDEFEENQTLEAKLVKQLDKLEMAMQALEYEHEHKLKLDNFFLNSRNSINDDFLKEVLEKLEDSRKK